MAKFAINASSAMLLPSSIKVTESISGSVVPLAMFYGECFDINLSILEYLMFIFAFGLCKCCAAFCEGLYRVSAKGS